MENIVIRKMKNSDAEQFVKLKNAVWRSAYAHIMPKEIFDSQDREVNERIEKFLKRDLNKNGHVGYVALIDEKIIGLADGVTLSFYDHYKDLGYAELCAVYIHADYQHFGLGKQFFNLITCEFIKTGCKKMVIGVLKENLQERRAYEKWGGVLDAAHEKMFAKFDKEFEKYEIDRIKNNSLEVDVVITRKNKKEVIKELKLTDSLVNYFYSKNILYSYEKCLKDFKESREKGKHKTFGIKHGNSYSSDLERQNVELLLKATQNANVQLKNPSITKTQEQDAYKLSFLLTSVAPIEHEKSEYGFDKDEIKSIEKLNSNLTEFLKKYNERYEEKRQASTENEELSAK